METTTEITEAMMEENIRTLGEKIGGIRVAMMTTVESDGVLRSRPMLTQETDFDGQLWFFTSIQSGKVEAIRNDQHVNIAFVSDDDGRYVSVAGRARVVRDRPKMEDLWSSALKAWFPKGIDDPDLALLCVEVESAEYWDSPSGGFVQLMGFTKALFTGKRFDIGEEHAKMDIRPTSH